MTGSRFNFGCTGCGACCDRPPELELGESLEQAGAFVLQLLLRPYVQPRRLGDWQRSRPGEAGGAAQQAWLAQRQQLAARAVMTFAGRAPWHGRLIDCTTYVTVSALALDLTPGRCHQLRERSCTIYSTRPHACRTVPFHHSFTELAIGAQFERFVATPGYRCDTVDTAELVVDAGALVAPRFIAARAAALRQVTADRPWCEAIAAAVAAGDPGFPSAGAIVENAAHGATTASILPAWRAGVKAGLIDAAVMSDALARQRAVIQAEMRRLIALGQGSGALFEDLRTLAVALNAGAE